MKTFFKYRYTFPIILLLLVCAKACAAYYLVSNYIIGLSPDEAQYWVWSKNLSIGYYSKSPGIAWLIWLTTKFVGDNELGVRSAAIIFSSLLTLSTYALIRSAYIERRYAFWGALIQMLSPMGIAASFAATTDVPMLLFWTLTLVYLFKNIHSPNYFTLGIVIALGAIFKWPQIYFLWLLIGSVFLWRWHWNELGLFLKGVLISLLGLLPSFIWNAQHNWATFRHITTQIIGDCSQMYSGNWTAFWAGQAGLVSPIFFILMIISLLMSLFSYRSLNINVRWSLFLTYILVALAVFRSIYENTQANWFLMIYPSAFVILMWYIQERIDNKVRWLYAGLSLSIVLFLITLSIPWLQSNNLLKIPYRVNAFQQSVGNRNITKAFKSLELDEYDFIFSDSYQDTSLIKFYGEVSQPVHYFNISDARNNQYDFWNGINDDFKGKNGLFVMIEKGAALSGRNKDNVVEYIHKLSLYFQRVDYVKSFPIFEANNSVVKQVTFFYCSNYNGQKPAMNSKF